MASEWLNIQDKVVIVTGGSSGIGATIVDSLLKEGAKVVNADLIDNGKEARELLFVKTNIAKREDVLNVVKETVTKFGTIDGVINNAGINLPRLLEAETVEVGVPSVLYSRFLNGVPRVIVAWLASFGLYS